MLGTLVPLLVFAVVVAVVEFRLPENKHIFLIAPLDFEIYRLAGLALNSEQNLYDGDFLPGLPFTYPPFAGALFRFLPVFTPLVGTILWQGASFVSLLIVLWLIYRKFTPAVLLAIGSLGFDAIHGGFFYGQINLILMLLVAVDFLPRNRRWAGIGVGLAAGLKLTPAFFVVIFIIERNWRALALTVSTFFATVFVGWLGVPDAMRFWTWAIRDSSRVGFHTNPGAQSLRSVMERILHIPQWWLPAVIVMFVLIVVAIWLAVQRKDLTWAMVLAGIGSCLVSPFSWFHHWVWIVPLAAVLTRNFERSNVQQFAAAMGTLVLLLPHLTFFISPHTATSLHPTSLWFTGIGVIVIVGYVVFGFVARRQARAPQPQSQPASPERRRESAVSAQTGTEGSPAQ